MSAVGPLKELERLLPQGLLADQLRIGWQVSRWLEAHRRAARPPHELDRWLAEARASIARRERRRLAVPPLHYPPDLPITARRDEIVAALQSRQVLVIAGEPGSGKTTQLPKFCLEAGLGVRARIGCTQPRRVAALSLSRRVAEELDRPWGREVGCKIRFTDETSAETYVKFMTDGILLAEAQADPVLSEYEAIIIDEAHERSLNIDFLLGLLKGLLDRRPDLKLIITSATIDTQAFARHFNDAPVIEVSGRTYPVDIEYRPIAPESDADESGEDPREAAADLTYVEACVAAVEEIIDTSTDGDILLFLPGERDILEARDALQDWARGRLELVPLFGRLSAEEQQRVFAPTSRRKVVLSTNIAETSLTVPGIRFVVDSGLARMSRYNPRTRTRRLPIEPISQSSARQRAGRCGRIGPGICYRLYAEDDFTARPPYTQPEIQRANLADVILRMKAFQLGDIESFPFLNPPLPAAIDGGYQVLLEIGALDAERQLTPLGRRLARLPVDPTIGRMILQARREGALAEVLVIAAGLSIQDPRERPADKLEAANAAHRRFHHPRSDFLTLLRIWEAYHDMLESLRTQSSARRFCREHFLSYLRMREWRDIHAQLEEVVRELGPDEETPGDAAPAATPHPHARERTPHSSRTDARHADAATLEEERRYAAIHRSVLTGLWSHVATRKERNLYRMGGSREAMVFPGSCLFERNAEPAARTAGKAPAAPKPRPTAQPQWLVAGEVVETSRRFLRTSAGIDPAWIVELAAHLVRRTYLDPGWDAKAGRVLALERISLGGLVVSERHVGYLQTHPREATDMFLREALVGEGLADHFQRPPEPESPGPARGRPSKTAIATSAPSTTSSETEGRDLTALPAMYAFLAHNHQLRHKIEIWQTRLQHRVVPDLDEALYAAYASRLDNVGGVADLNRRLREEHGRDPKFLCFQTADLLGEKAGEFDTTAFPDAVRVGKEDVHVQYAYAPGQERDGVTVRLPFTLAQIIDPALLDWAVPGLREPQILHLLQALPKDLRRTLMPLPPKARELANTPLPSGSAFLPALIHAIADRYTVKVPPTAWQHETLPPHLKPRFEILGRNQQPVASGRDLATLRTAIEHHDTTAESAAWQQAVAAWERYGLTGWPVDTVPERIPVADVAGFALEAFPALHVESGEVSLRLFRKATDAEVSHPAGVRRLLELGLAREWAWLQKDLRTLSKWKVLHATLGPGDDLEAAAFEHLQTHLLARRGPSPRTADAFAQLLDATRAEVRGLVPGLSDRVGEILELRQALLMVRQPYPGLRAELDHLIPPGFLRFIPHARLADVVRYLKAMVIRAERAAVNPAKDREKLQRIKPWTDALAGLRLPRPVSPALYAKWAGFRWLVEEWKVSTFAQELGTAGPVSPARLEQALAEVKQALAGPTPPRATG